MEMPQKRMQKYRIRLAIRNGSFFNEFNLPVLKILKVLLRWSLNIPQGLICCEINIDYRTLKKIILKFIKIVNIYDKIQDKLGGPGVVVEIDKTSLNHNIEANRGRVPKKQDDSLC